MVRPANRWGRRADGCGSAHVPAPTERCRRHPVWAHPVLIRPPREPAVGTVRPSVQSSEEEHVPGYATPRRTRFRRARHAPGPSGIRPLGRAEAGQGEEGAQPAEAGPRHGKLVTWGAVITIVASVGGLLATGVGTIYSALVANDQLTQSQEQREDQQREQASRVSVWVADSGVHVLNRSPDPVVDARVTFYAWWPDFTRSSNKRHVRDVTFNIVLGDLPPCTDTVMDRKALRFMEGTPAWTPPQPGVSTKPLPDVAVISGLGIWFVDRDGVEWSRVTGDLGRDDDDSENGSIGPGAGQLGIVTKEPQVRPASGCGSEAKS